MTFDDIIDNLHETMKEKHHMTIRDLLEPMYDMIESVKLSVDASK